MNGTAGTLMASEIAEQPEVWQRLLGEGLSSIKAAAATIAARSPRFVLFAARGTSDHAALYGKYLVEIEHGLPVGLMSPSTMTVYAARPDLREVLVVAISQSGGSPDLVQSLRTARERGATTLAITNAADSALAAEAEIHVDVLAGEERSVAATKSYTAQLLVLRLLLGALRGDDPDTAKRLPGLAP
ncbi:MAG: SIS domain-containing protein, partial [Ornithinimicrobium sp.]